MDRQIARLITLSIMDKLNPEETQILNAWLSDPINKAAYEELCDPAQRKTMNDHWESIDVEAARKQVSARINKYERRKKQTKYYMKYSLLYTVQCIGLVASGYLVSKTLLIEAIVTTSIVVAIGIYLESLRDKKLELLQLQFERDIEKSYEDIKQLLEKKGRTPTKEEIKETLVGFIKDFTEKSKTPNQQP